MENIEYLELSLNYLCCPGRLGCINHFKFQDLYVDFLESYYQYRLLQNRICQGKPVTNRSLSKWIY